MAEHTSVCILIHMMWPTKLYAPVLVLPVSDAVSEFLHRYGPKKDIKILRVAVQPDHVHTLFNLPPDLSVENVAKLLKGASSHWLNRKRLLAGKFAWERGYAAFTISPSRLPQLVHHFDSQEAYHREHTYLDELHFFADVYHRSSNGHKNR